MTVTGETLARNLADAAPLASGQQVIHPIEQPVFPRGHLRILRGNLAPDGAVAKITGKEGERFAGDARVYDSEEAMLAGLERGEIAKGSVVVIRYEGPKGGPGMPEMLTPTSAIMGAGLGNDIAMITDGRFSGGSHGFIIGHITPEAQDGGAIALLRDGDRIIIDASKCELHVELSDQERARLLETGVPISSPRLVTPRSSLVPSMRALSQGSFPESAMCHFILAPLAL